MAISRSFRKSRGLYPKHRSPRGAPPGTLTQDPTAPKPHIHVLAYTQDDFFESPVVDLDELPKIVERYATTWINVDGLGDVDIIQQIGKLFDLHRLAVEDVVNVHQRPKVEQYPDHLFIVCRTVALQEHAETEQMSLFLSHKFVISFQERPGDCFDPLRKRIREGRGRLREAPADYLAYAMIDAIVDSYFPILEVCGERIEKIEEQLLSVHGHATVAQIHQIKRDILLIRRAVWPLREEINILLRERSAWISDETKYYLRDCYDHTVQIMDHIESYREIGSGLMDVALSRMNHRLNEIMRVLTVISTIFIPLNFVASIYGMNFNTTASGWNMPELNWTYGYPLALLLMSVIAFGQFWFFYNRGWLGSLERATRRASLLPPESLTTPKGPPHGT